jgi:hypothetical protein
LNYFRFLVITAVLGITLIVLAILVQLGSTSARVALTIIGAIYILLSLSSFPWIGDWVGIPYIIVVIVLFWRESSGDWCRERKYGIR